VTTSLSHTVMEIWRLKSWTDGRTDAQVILYSVQCYALHSTDKKKQLQIENDNENGNNERTGDGLMN